jgi:dihydroneopterin aldolase
MASINKCPFSSLSLDRFQQKVRLGWGEEERRIAQDVSFDIRIRFNTIPKGCVSDQLNETICYKELSDQIREVCQKREYRLIENLGWTVFEKLKGSLPDQVQLFVRAIKEKPPIPDLKGSAHFCVSDWLD